MPLSATRPSFSHAGRGREGPLPGICRAPCGKKPCGAAGAAGPALTYRLPSPAAMHSRRAAAILAPRGRARRRPGTAAPPGGSA